ncbi:MAG: hypothetical protein M1321_03220 [Candidatus Marsarchaeota archaeon]|nr:hypothetical protein [Candidatus Marsarchaeota archaeon]
MSHEVQRIAGSFGKKTVEYGLPFAIYLAIALVMFWGITQDAPQILPNSAGVSYQGAWGLWWVDYATFVLHQNPYFSNFILYPIGANLARQGIAPVAAMLTWPLQQVSLALAYNVLLFLGFALSGLFMYMLAAYIVKNRYAAFVAGLIFAFAPVHIAQSYTGLRWASVEFMPLFALLFLMAVREARNKYRNSVLAGAAFFLLTFFGGVQQGAMMLFFAVVSFLIIAVLEIGSIDRRALSAVALMAVVALALSAPLLALMAAAPGQAAQQQGPGGIAREMLYSDTVASFFLPGFDNGLFSKASAGYYNETYGLNYAGTATTSAAGQKVSYLGYAALALAIVGAFRARRKERARMAYWLAVLAVFAVLALGPVLQLVGTRQGIPSGPVNVSGDSQYANASGFPMPYLLYSGVPVINSVDQPGAFDFVAEMALAVLAAFGVDALLSSRGPKGNALALAVALSLLVLIEYNGMPLSASSARGDITNATVPSGFYQLAGFSSNFTVLSLPALPAENGSYDYPGLAMLYSAAAEKQLVGGYPAAINSSQQDALEAIPLVVQTTYLEGRQGFEYPYPINENYSNLTIFWLGEYKIGIVSMSNSAFRPNDSVSLVNYMESVFGQYPYRDSNVTIFQTADAIKSHAGKDIVAYIVGNWTPGYAFCAQQCNSVFATMWWGSNPRGIYLVAPKSGVMVMRTDALSYYSHANVSVMDNGRQVGFINATNITASRQAFSIRINATRGLNALVFREPGSSLERLNPGYAQYPYFNFGIYNMSFTYANDTTT